VSKKKEMAHAMTYLGDNLPQGEYHTIRKQAQVKGEIG
jgi:hypothetical protein